MAILGGGSGAGGAGGCGRLNGFNCWVSGVRTEVPGGMEVAGLVKEGGKVEDGEPAGGRGSSAGAAGRGLGGG